jgi:uncharacterized transporter YbjL
MLITLQFVRRKVLNCIQSWVSFRCKSTALGLAPGLAVGLMGGAMTTTPTLAAAQDAVRSGLVEAPPGYHS